MYKDLKNKVAIVTGARRGMGRTHALKMAQEGVKVVVSDISEEDCQKVVEEIKKAGGKAMAVKCDVSKKKEVEGLVKKTVDKFGKVDILVNNAGICQFKPFLELTEEEWDRTLDINLKGYFLCAQAVSKEMAKQKSPARNASPARSDAVSSGEHSEAGGPARNASPARSDAASSGEHSEAGGPAKSDEIPTYLLGVNQEKYDLKKDDIISMGSCTTNCLAPIAKVLDQEFGIVKGFMTTIHSYTNDQRILDLAHKDLRRSRAAGINIIPTTTGAAKTVEKCLPQLKGKLDGLALRVPTPTVSIIDFVCQVGKSTSAEEVNYILKKSSEKEWLRGILGIEDAPLVSSDYKGNSYSAIVDALSTMVQGNLIKVLVWYDNEYGYACRLAEMAEYIGDRI